MLNIYRGRESIDKEKFIYDSIRSSEAGGGNPVLRERTIVIVPDQYTLEAEKQAMDRLNEEVLLDVEITGITHLGSNLIKESGKSGHTLINRYGRHMMVSRILGDLDEELIAFKGLRSREGFVEAVNNFISAAKRSNVSPEDFLMLTEGKDTATEDGAFLRKLKDLALIYAKYQEWIDGKYTDGEDLRDLYIESVAASKTLPKCRVWVYGFDSFTVKNLSFIMALATKCKEVNVFLTYDRDCRDEDLFAISETLTNKFLAKAEEMSVPVKVTDIKPSPELVYIEKAPGIKHLEKNLFAVGPEKSEDHSGIEITECLNPYNEAEAAAAYVLKLLREEKYKLSDIDLICNDQDERGPIIGRMFREYGLDVFDDKTRRVMNSPIAIYILSLIEIVAFGYRTPDVIRLTKTGLTGIPEEALEELENYVWKYDIKGSMWKKPFSRGEHEDRYKDGVLAEIDETRKKVVALPEALEAIYKGASTYGEFAEQYMDLLQSERSTDYEAERHSDYKAECAITEAERTSTEVARTSTDYSFLDRISFLAERQVAAGLMENAEETLQIWDTVVELLEQIKEIMDEEPFDGKEFAKLFRSGMSQVEVGVLPPTPDDILLGTMQRTRSGDAKAVLVLGANDGLLPVVRNEDILFSREELQTLSDAGNELGLDSETMMMEEDLAIYRNLSKPSEHLWISYSTGDTNGDKLLPSTVVENIKKLFKNLNISRDPIASGDILNYIGGRINTLRHYTDAKRDQRLGKEIDPGWSVVGAWLRDEDAAGLQQVFATLNYENYQEPLGDEMAQALFARGVDSAGKGIYGFSPSALERYSFCPFSYFVSYGLRAQELRQDAVGSREIGDLYHNVLERFMREVTEKNLWDEIGKEEAYALVEKIADEWTEEYRSNLFTKSNQETYSFRRAIKICKYIAWTLVEHRRAGTVDDSFYEVNFGRRGYNDAPRSDSVADLHNQERSSTTSDTLLDEFKRDSEGHVVLAPIVRELTNGRAYIRGVIDRVDILPDGRVKIIDYKTGNEEFNKKEAEAGLRIQLLLYLEAAQENKRKPAGVFYFLIHEPEHISDSLLDNDDSSKSTIDQIIKDSYRMDGIMLADDEVIRAIVGDFEKRSEVVKLTRKNDGDLDAHSLKRLLTEDEFTELQETVKDVTRELCENISLGKIDIAPKKSKKKDPCAYCDYSNICRFSPTLKGCEYEVIT